MIITPLPQGASLTPSLATVSSVCVFSPDFCPAALVCKLLESYTNDLKYIAIKQMAKSA